jgi:serine/threonine protein kinase
MTIVSRIRREYIVETEQIIRVYDDLSPFPIPTCVLIFMELCDGSLENLIKQSHKFTELKAKQWFRQIASALKYLHDQNMGHCGIKPANILY